MKATVTEMKEEAIERLKRLKVSCDVLERYPEAFDNILVTCFGEGLSRTSKVHDEVLSRFKKISKDSLPFYITESWHGQDVISILFVDPEKEQWEEERESANEGYHMIYAYSLDEQMGEYGYGIFSIEDGLLWRVG